MVIIMSEVFEKVFLEIDRFWDEMVNIFIEFIKILVISFDYGGEGEYDKVQKFFEIIKDWFFDRVEVYEVFDERVKNGVRLSILVYYYGEEGEKSLCFWILIYFDVVLFGDLSKWMVIELFKFVVKDGKVYGRGLEDNGQSFVVFFYVVRVMMNFGIRLKRIVIFVFVSDEEIGSYYGVEWLIKNYLEFFRKDDLVLVLDGGNEDGIFIEVVEKSIFWFKLKVRGKQVYVSMFDKGFNVYCVVFDLVYYFDKFFYEKYNKKDELFEFLESIFELMMVQNLVDFLNIVLGEYEVVFDCRVLLDYSFDDIFNDVKVFVDEVKERYKREIEGKVLFEIDVEIFQRFDVLVLMDLNSEIVVFLKEVIKKFCGKEVKVGGIGGGIFVVFFRKFGVFVVVWVMFDEIVYQFNEYVKIDNMVEDVKVMVVL